MKTFRVTMRVNRNFSVSKQSMMIMKLSSDRCQFSTYGQKWNPLFSSLTADDAVVTENNNNLPHNTFKEVSKSSSTPTSFPSLNARSTVNSEVILPSKLDDVSSNIKQFHWNISSQPFSEEVCKVLLNPLSTFLCFILFL